MLIVLEGCDGSGKTTLAKLLADVSGGRIIHCTKDTPNDFHFFKGLIEIAKDSPVDIIADRWCYGQFVYQDFDERPLNGEDYDCYQALLEIEGLMLKNNAKVVFVDAPSEVIAKRLAQRDETLINGLTIDEVRKRFRDIQKNSLLTWIEYNTGGTDNGTV